jgi:ribosome-associated toxin RatA of RatAB toxin-antitoxin module
MKEFFSSENGKKYVDEYKIIQHYTDDQKKLFQKSEIIKKNILEIVPSFVSKTISDDIKELLHHHTEEFYFDPIHNTLKWSIYSSKHPDFYFLNGITSFNAEGQKRCRIDVTIDFSFNEKFNKLSYSWKFILKRILEPLVPKIVFNEMKHLYKDLCLFRQE